MEALREDVHVIRLMPRHCMNAYLVGDIVVDAGTKGSAKKILAAVEGRDVAAHALTHAHGDHVGGSKKLVDALGVPVWVGEADAQAAETGVQVTPDTRAGALLRRAGGWDGVPVSRRLREGDELGHGFTVLEVPGHSPGHVAFWRERDRTLVGGDVFFNLHLGTLRYGLREPPGLFTPDPARNRESMRRLAALEPDLVLLGHGEPIRHAAPKLSRFVADLGA